jgi:NAD(P)H-quinone oxidoreductase subunit 2
MTFQSLVFFLPELIILAAALVVVIGGLALEREGGADPEQARLFAAGAAIVGCLASLVALYYLLGRTGSAVDPMNGAFVVDHYAIYVKAILVVFAIVTILMGYRFSDRFRPHQSEFLGLVLLATVGGMFMASAREMIEAYVALETLSISLYVMVAFNKGDRRSSEAGG